jgi:hypothetical protein
MRICFGKTKTNTRNVTFMGTSDRLRALRAPVANKAGPPREIPALAGMRHRAHSHSSVHVFQDTAAHAPIRPTTLFLAAHCPPDFDRNAPASGHMAHPTPQRARRPI